MLDYNPPPDPADATAKATTRDYNLGTQAPSLTVGLDLGQATDYSALAVVEHVHVLPSTMSLQGFWWEVEKAQRDLQDYGMVRGWGLPASTPELHVRHLQRWDLGTPYHVIVDDVCRLMGPESPLWGARLIFDRSGVGRAWETCCSPRDSRAGSGRRRGGRRSRAGRRRGPARPRRRT